MTMQFILRNVLLALRNALIFCALLFAAILFAIVVAYVIPAHAVVRCNYTPSGPVTASYDGQIFYNLAITAYGVPAVNTNGHFGVGVTGVTIHQYGASSAIVSYGGFNNWVENTTIIKMDAPKQGANPGFYDGIYCYQSPGLYVKGLTVRDVSTGIWLEQCNGSRLLSIEGYNMRGPFYHGQLAVFITTSNSSLVNFYSFNDPLISHPEDNVNAWQSSNITISNGLIDGNNGPNDVGVQVDAGSYNIAVSNVDAINVLGGCFAAFGPPRWNVQFSNVGCRDMAAPGIRGPTKAGYAFIGAPPAHPVSGIAFYNASYFNVPAVYYGAPPQISQIASVDFTPMQPFHNNLCE